MKKENISLQEQLLILKTKYNEPKINTKKIPNLPFLHAFQINDNLELFKLTVSVLDKLSKTNPNFELFRDKLFPSKLQHYNAFNRKKLTPSENEEVQQTIAGLLASLVSTMTDEEQLKYEFFVVIKALVHFYKSHVFDRTMLVALLLLLDFPLFSKLLSVLFDPLSEEHSVLHTHFDCENNNLDIYVEQDVDRTARVLAKHNRLFDCLVSLLEKCTVTTFTFNWAKLVNKKLSKLSRGNRIAEKTQILRTFN